MRERFMSTHRISTKKKAEFHLAHSTIGSDLYEICQAYLNQQWKDISTAPKDGTEFQAWVVTENGNGFWEPRCKFDEDEGFGIWGRVDYDIDDWDFGLTHLTPVKWMPLPPPPESE